MGRRAGRGELGRIEVGYVGSAAYAGVLQRELSRFRADHPGVDLRIHERRMVEIGPAVDGGDLDIGLVRLPVDLPASLAAHVLSRDHFILALPADHPLASKAGPIEPRRLASETLIMPEQEAGAAEVIRRGGFVGGAPLRPGSLFAVLTQVSFGAGLAVTPSVVAEAVRLPGLAFKSIAGAPIPSALAAVVRRRESAPATCALIAQLKAASPPRG